MSSQQALNRSFQFRGRRRLNVIPHHTGRVMFCLGAHFGGIVTWSGCKFTLTNVIKRIGDGWMQSNGAVEERKVRRRGDEKWKVEEKFLIPSLATAYKQCLRWIQLHWTRDAWSFISTLVCTYASHTFSARWPVGWHVWILSHYCMVSSCIVG